MKLKELLQICGYTCTPKRNFSKKKKEFFKNKGIFQKYLMEKTAYHTYQTYNKLEDVSLT